MSENHTPAQQAAARGTYEDVQASTGGETKLTAPQTADPVQGVDPEADTEATPPAGDDVPAAALRTEESPELIVDPAAAVAQEPPAQGETDGDALLAAERLADLQRLQAEYVNYKRRVDRDRALESERAIAGFVEALLPVLDEIHLARQHGELEGGPFAKIAEKFESILAKYGVQRYGEPGETFDPTVHEAVMHVQAELAPGTTELTVVQVLQPGYRIGERVVRPAMVSVADPG